MTPQQTALVLGATGGIGSEVARQLLAAGWRVRALRRQAPPSGSTGIEWRLGDALDAQAVAAAAEGCAAIVHAVNPPGYRNWDTQVLPMLDNTLAAAVAQKACVILPGNVYNFGPDAFPCIAEDAPQQPLTRKGAIRVEMERRLEAATRRGAQAIIVRAGDFFGAQAKGNWFAQAMIKPGAPVRSVQNLALPGTVHQWAYLPDVARTMVALLAERARLPAFNRFHMAGHVDRDGSEMAAAVARVVARHSGLTPKIGRFPMWLIDVLSPFLATFREMREMRYLWRESVWLDNTKLVATLGHEPHTPLDAALEASLRGLGCLPAASESSRRVRSGQTA